MELAECKERAALGWGRFQRLFLSFKLIDLILQIQTQPAAGRIAESAGAAEQGAAGVGGAEGRARAADL